MISPSDSDQAILATLGARLKRARLALDLTQAHLADEAGVSKRTVERLEAGGSTQLSTFVRILRVLGLLDNLDAFLPERRPQPMDLLERQGRERQRASGREVRPAAIAQGAWTWGDEG